MVVNILRASVIFIALISVIASFILHWYTVRCRYNAVYLLHQGEVWDVFFPTSDLYFASIPSVMYVIPCYIGPRYWTVLVVFAIKIAWQLTRCEFVFVKLYTCRYYFIFLFKSSKFKCLSLYPCKSLTIFPSVLTELSGEASLLSTLLDNYVIARPRKLHNDTVDLTISTSVKQLIGLVSTRDYGLVIEMGWDSFVMTNYWFLYAQNWAMLN